MCLTNKGEEKQRGGGEKAASGLVKRFFFFYFKWYDLVSEFVCFTVCHKAALRFLLLYHSFLIKSGLFPLVRVLLYARSSVTVGFNHL